MRASAAVWSTWRQAQQNAAARTASQQTRSNYSGTAASQPGVSAAGGASSHLLAKSSPSEATAAAAPVVAWPRQQEGTLHPAAAQVALRQEPPSLDEEGPQIPSNAIPDNRDDKIGTPHKNKASGGESASATAGPGGAGSVDPTRADVVSGQTVAGVSGQRQDGDSAAGGGGQATNARGGHAGPGPASLAATLAEYGRLRMRSGAPHPAWIIGSPLIQVCASVTFCADSIAECLRMTASSARP